MMRAWYLARREDVRGAFRGDAGELAVWSCVCVALGTMIFSIAIAQAAVLLAGVFWIVRVVRTPGYGFRRSPLLLPMVLFVLARIAAIPLSIDPALSADAFRTEIFFYVLFFVVHFEWDALREDRLRFAVLLLIAAGVVATLVGFVKYAQGIDERLTSTTAGYYTMGMYLAAVFALSFALGRRTDIYPNRAVWLAVNALLLLGLLFTFNRLHWVVAAVAALIVGIARERRILAVLAVLGIAAVIAVEPLQVRFLQLLDAGGNMSGRDVIWRGAFMLIGERPLTGFGLRTFHQVFPLFDEAPDKGIGSWHNDYLQVYMDSGLMALLPFVAVLAVVVVMGWRSHRRWRAGSLQRDLNAAVMLVILCFALAGGMLDSLLSIFFRTFIAVAAVLYLQRPGTSAAVRGAGTDT